MTVPHINYGDTLVVTCTCQDASGTPINLTTAGITPSAFITEPDGIAVVPQGAITVTPSDQTAHPGMFTITSDTSLWDNNIGIWSLLIRYTDAAGVKTSADRIQFEVC